MIPGAKGQNPHELAHKLIGFDLNTILFKSTIWRKQYEKI